MTLLDWLLRAGLVLTLALLAERSVRSLSHKRLWLLIGALGALSLPLLGAALPAAWEPLPPLDLASAAEWLPRALEVPGPASVPPRPEVAATAAWPIASERLTPLLNGLWAVGAVGLALRALMGRLWLAGVLRRARPAPTAWAGADAEVPLRLTDELPGAGLAGPWPRAVLLPLEAEGWEPRQRDWVLQHERAHARAGDDLWLALMQGLTIVLWPLPPAWWVQRRARLVAEWAADRAVLTSGAPALAYASALTRLARHGGAALVAASGGGLLERRVTALLGAPPPPARPITLAAASALGLLVVSAAAAQPGGAAPPAGFARPPAPTLQAALSAELARLQQAWRPRDAALILLDARTGQRLASADLSEGRLLETPLPLGSVLKPFAVAGALEAGLPADVRFDGRGGRWALDGGEVRDLSPQPELTLTDVLAQSSNIGAASLAERVGVEALLRAYRAVGVERVPDHLADGGLAAAHLAMGVGAEVSPLRLARAYALFAQGGVEPATGQRRFQAQTVEVVRAGLAAALAPPGTAQAAAVPGMLGGKTGTTAEGPGQAASFVGLAEDAVGPVVVVVVVVEAQGEHPYGGQVAAPVAARLVQVLRGAERTDTR